jgi:hypothetical protein
LEWSASAAWVSAFIAFLAINAATVRWLLDRRGEAHLREANRVDGIAKEITELKIALPLEYVRREDWIRFGNTIDKKLDDIRDEIRGARRGLRTGDAD